MPSLTLQETRALADHAYRHSFHAVLNVGRAIQAAHDIYINVISV